MAPHWQGVVLRCTREEREQLKARAKAANLSLNQFVRRILGLPEYRIVRTRIRVDAPHEVDQRANDSADP